MTLLNTSISVIKINFNTRVQVILETINYDRTRAIIYDTIIAFAEDLVKSQLSDSIESAINCVVNEGFLLRVVEQKLKHVNLTGRSRLRLNRLYSNIYRQATNRGDELTKSIIKYYYTRNLGLNQQDADTIADIFDV